MDMTSINMDIAEAISKRMNHQGTSRLQLSKESYIPYATLSRKLNGINEFTTSELLRIGMALGCSAKEFLACFDGCVSDEKGASNDK
ncbi:MAG: helix-turn-helix domain-containing protein [Propionibacteriaceae bacterium]|nr:helix-turn-helix domain-containing protein [Propionibacteriaceae bacterium]